MDNRVQSSRTDIEAKETNEDSAFFGTREYLTARIPISYSKHKLVIRQ